MAGKKGIEGFVLDGIIEGKNGHGNGYSDGNLCNRHLAVLKAASARQLGLTVTVRYQL